jgi:hypothetical protein
LRDAGFSRHVTQGDGLGKDRNWLLVRWHRAANPWLGKGFLFKPRKDPAYGPSPIGNVGKTFSQLKARPDPVIVQGENRLGLGFSPPQRNLVIEAAPAARSSGEERQP